MKVDLSQSPTMFELAREKMDAFFAYERGDRVITAVVDGSPIAQALYTYVDVGVKCELSGWVEPGKGDLIGRPWLRAMFEIPFIQWRCHRLTAVTKLSKPHVADQLMRLGFAVEAPLISWYAGQAPDDEPEDGLMFCMLRRNCRWIR